MRTITQSPILIIARNEFDRAIGNPLIVVVALIMFIMAVINGAAASTYFQGIENYQSCDPLIRSGLGQIFYDMSLLCTVVALFLGVISVAEDRHKHTLGVLVSKPLYRRDVIAGKFLGLNAFIMLLIIMTVIGSSAFLIVFFRAPVSMAEFILRVSSLIVALYLNCSLSVCIAMLIGIVFRNLLASISFAATFLFLEYYAIVVKYLGDASLGQYELISPRMLYLNIVWVNGRQNLLDTTTPYLSWLSATAPYAFLMIAEIVLILLIDCAAFTKVDEASGG